MEKFKKVYEFVVSIIKRYRKPLGIALAIILSIFILRGVRIMTFRRSLVSYNKPRTHKILATRGNIYDCNGNIIATNKEVHDIFIDCCVIDSPDEWKTFSRKLAQDLAEILPEKTAPQWWVYFQNARKQNNRYLPIIKNTSKETIDTLMNSTSLKKGYKSGRIHISRTVREYPYGNLARRTIGAWNSGTETYMFGIERSFNDELKGQDGYVTTCYDFKRRSFDKVVVDSKPVFNGYSIHTTLDMSMQAMADSLLHAVVESSVNITGGCLALMEVKTGKIRAIANTHKTDKGLVGEYLNYSLDYAYEPGAVAEPISLAAALSDGIIKSMNDENNIGEKYSGCEDYFYEWYKTLCISRSNFDIKEMRNVCFQATKDTNHITAMSKGFEFTICPMHLLVFYNTIANDGIMMRPMVIDSLVNDTYSTKISVPQELNSRALRQEVTDSLKKALSLHAGGIIGKTGLAQQVIAPESKNPYQDTSERKQYVKTFAGFFPEEEPQYSIVCALFTKPINSLPTQTFLPSDVVQTFVDKI